MIRRMLFAIIRSFNEIFCACESKKTISIQIMMLLDTHVASNPIHRDKSLLHLASEHRHINHSIMNCDTFNYEGEKKNEKLRNDFISADDRMDLMNNNCCIS